MPTKPKKLKAVHTARISVAMPPALVRAARARARKDKVRLSDVHRAALEAYLDD